MPIFVQQISPWHRPILLPLWIIQLTIIVPGLQIDRLTSTWPGILFTLAYYVCLPLHLRELAAYCRNDLSPHFYLATQVSKLLLPKIAVLVWITAASSSMRSSEIKATIFRVLTHRSVPIGLVGVFYATYIFRRRHSIYRVHEISQEPTASRSSSTWKSRANLPIVVRAIHWIYSGSEPAVSSPKPRLLYNWVSWAMRYATGCLPVAFMSSIGSRFPGEPRSWLASEVPFMADWDYPSLTLESEDSYSDEPVAIITSAAGEPTSADLVRMGDLEGPSSNPSLQNPAEPPSSRLLGPRYLCVLTDLPHGLAGPAYTTKKVSQWRSEHSSTTEPDYIFISYTRRQFYTQIYGDPSVACAELVRRRVAAEADQETLIQHAVNAAQSAGVCSFWIDFECVRPEEGAGEYDDMEDVYRICDIARAAYSMVIILGPSLDAYQQRSDSTSSEMLHEWGTRLWTVPEALLCPSEHRIKIYTLGSAAPIMVAKRNLPSLVWGDASELRQLIEHYEGSLPLTQLELISIALECLHRRHTEKRNSGDVAYALMGLLRLRPKVRKTDTGFQAFARLSVANDSNMILERMMCLRSTDSRASWHDMTDSWQAKLWHIKPLFEISGIGDHNTISIGDASGTLIDWELKMVDFTPNAGSWRRSWLIFRLFCMVPPMWITGLIMFCNAYMTSDRKLYETYTFFNGWTSLGMLSTILLPMFLVRRMRCDKASVQRHVFALEGKPDLREVEPFIFGMNGGQLRWSEHNLHQQSPNDHRPTYTLIDTCSRTATSFHAETAPTMMFVGGREQGLVRVLLCSYDTVTQTYVKETVVRFEGKMTQRLSRLGRFRFSVCPDRDETFHEESADPDLISLPDIPEFRSLEDV